MSAGKSQLQVRIAQYLNEIVSLTIMGLMVLALVSAQRAPDVQNGTEGLLEVVVVEDMSFRQAGELQ